MKKETAIDWLVDQIKSVENQKGLSAQDWLEVIEKAKAMEKEQMIGAYDAGKDDHHHMSYAEQWYNETYGGDK